jgi:hypothetical protein
VTFQVQFGSIDKRRSTYSPPICLHITSISTSVLWAISSPSSTKTYAKIHPSMCKRAQVPLRPQLCHRLNKARLLPVLECNFIAAIWCSCFKYSLSKPLIPSSIPTFYAHDTPSLQLPYLNFECIYICLCFPSLNISAFDQPDTCYLCMISFSRSQFTFFVILGDSGWVRPNKILLGS